MHTITEKILDILYDIGTASSDIIFTDYSSSYKNMRRRIFGVKTKEQHKRDEKFEAWKQGIKEQQKFFNMLCYLHKKGFIEKEGSSNKSRWNITKKGIEKLKLLKQNKKPRLSPFSSDVADDSVVKIIIFDIPESEKKKRNWLRLSLRNMNFFMLQKSVWIGRKKLPEEFMMKLKEFNIFQYVHIFAINEKGTINLNSILQQKEK